MLSAWQGDAGLAGEVALGYSAHLVALLAVEEQRVGEEAAKLLAALLPCGSPPSGAFAQELTAQDWAAEPLAQLLAGSSLRARRAGAAAVRAVADAGGAEAAGALTAAGVLRPLLEMLTGRTGRQQAAEALLALAATDPGREGLHALEWGGAAGSKPSLAVTGALGRLLGVAGEKGAGGRLAAVRTLGCLAAHGGADWQAEVPRRGRLRLVVAMVAGQAGLSAEDVSGVPPPDGAESLEGSIAAALALADMVGSAKVSGVSHASWALARPTCRRAQGGYDRSKILVRNIVCSRTAGSNGTMCRLGLAGS